MEENFSFGLTHHVTLGLRDPMFEVMCLVKVMGKE